jgi:hypothetical protein
VQFAHCWPLLPHAVSSVPPMHSPPKQQPLQLPGPHAGVTQRPPPHASPSFAQCWQDCAP